MAAIGTALMLALFGLLLLGLGAGGRAAQEATLRLINLADPPPPPKLVEVPLHRPDPGGSGSPRPSPAPRARTPAETPAPTPQPAIPVIAAPAPAPAPMAGGGSGSGNGVGLGGSGSGRGAGAGDGDGDETPPEQIRGRLNYSDLPQTLRRLGQNQTVHVRYQVEADGRVGGCRATDRNGNAELEALTCRLIQQRFRFEPSRDGEGRAVRSTIEENQSWIIEREPDEQR